MEISFNTYSTKNISQSLLERCSSLFSEHYGVWGLSAPAQLCGKRVRLSSHKLKEQFLWDKDKCFLSTASLASGELIGHIFFVIFPFMEHEAVWITQLVVHTECRSKGIATKLCTLAYQRDQVAWGLVSSHPYAVRALEHATNRRCDPRIIAQHAEALVQSSGLPYAQNKSTRMGPRESILLTDFHVDHTQVDAIVRAMNAPVGALEDATPAQGDTRTHMDTQPLAGGEEEKGEWKLGILEPGDEYFAFTFKQQK